MTDACYAAARNNSGVLIPLQRKMKAGLFTAAATALTAACAPSTASRIPATEIPRPNPPVVLPPFRMDSTLTIDRVPAFQTEPLITWGPPPDGVTHAERARKYDLQHQVTTVRFNWARHAVVGT